METEAIKEAIRNGELCARLLRHLVTARAMLEIL